MAVDNEQQHPESFTLTDRELMTRAGIKSGQTIVEARRQLKNAGLIDFKAGKDADADAQAKPLSSSTFDANDIQSEWVKEFGYDLRGNRALEIEQLASKDYARAQAAIARTLAQKEKQGISNEYPYFRAVYDGLKPTAEPVKEKTKKERRLSRAT